MNRSVLLDEIRFRVGSKNLFTGNLFNRRNGSVDLTGIAEDDRVVVDLDKVFPHGRQGESQCECILFYIDNNARFVVVLIELKGGKNAEASKAAKQLNAGATIADTYIQRNIKCICRPILFHNSISRAEVTQLKKAHSKVHFKGNSYEIKTARCGTKLTDVFPY